MRASAWEANKLSKDKIINFPSFSIHKESHLSVNLTSSFVLVLVRKRADPCVEWSWTLNNLDDFFFFFFEVSNILILSCTAAYRVSIMGSCLGKYLASAHLGFSSINAISWCSLPLWSGSPSGVFWLQNHFVCIGAGGLRKLATWIKALVTLDGTMLSGSKMHFTGNARTVQSHDFSVKNRDDSGKGRSVSDADSQ